MLNVVKDDVMLLLGILLQWLMLPLQLYMMPNLSHITHISLL
jgi:hypothetical protein